MRRFFLVLTLLLAPTLLGADDQTTKPITPKEAAQHVDKKCVVEMEVKSTGQSGEAKLIFLNSEANYRDANNFTVVIDAKAAEQLQKAKIQKPADYYKGKTIRVTGTVSLYREHPQIKVEKADQIQVVEKK